MLIKELLKIGQKKLKGISETYKLDGEVLLAYILKRDRAYLISHRDDVVSQDKINKYLKLIKRRSRGEPIAYITNKKEFYGYEFYVDKNVFIPRPETEGLVEISVRKIKNFFITKDFYVNIGTLKRKRQVLKIVDVCAGSGCVGISILKELIFFGINKIIKTEITFVDISRQALSVAKKNCKKLIGDVDNIVVKFVRSDLLTNIEEEFDVVVSNPPYVPSSEIGKLSDDVRNYEPRLALDGGEDGMLLIRKLLKQAVKRLKKCGIILLEIDDVFKNDLKNWLKVDVRMRLLKFMFHKDDFGKWRYLVIWKNAFSNI